MKKIIASGPVIIQNNKLLVTKDKKDNFYKIPGGTLERNETLEECAIRELKEETGLDCKIVSKLATMELTKNPKTKEGMKIELHHYSTRLNEKIINYKTFYYENHEVKWIPIEKIKQGKYEVAPNIYFLINKKEI